ncbi:hypothetical protein KAR91_70560 [Candidatus Pacearchaeota archaeon]|nr:hypothetical protein [Candidatus Pacearchaeota archaeon]
MKNSEYIETNCLPIINIELLNKELSKIILWYDKTYCKSIDGADEVVGEYLCEEYESELTVES